MFQARLSGRSVTQRGIWPSMAGPQRGPPPGRTTITRAEKGLLVDVLFPALPPDHHPVLLVFPQYTDDLFFGESFLHVLACWVTCTGRLTFGWYQYLDHISHLIIKCRSQTNSAISSNSLPATIYVIKVVRPQTRRTVVGD